MREFVVTQLALWPPDRTIVVGARSLRVKAKRAWCPACDAFVDLAAVKPEHAMRIHYRRKHTAGNWSTDSIKTNFSATEKTHIKHRLVATVRTVAVELRRDPDSVLNAVRNIVNCRDISVREGVSQRQLREAFNQLLGG